MAALGVIDTSWEVLLTSGSQCRQACNK